DQTRLKDILDRARSIGRRWTGGRFDVPRRVVGNDLTRFQRAALDRLLEDAGAPTGTNAILLRLGDGSAPEGHDVEPGLILVRSVAGNALCDSGCGVTRPKRVAGERLCEGPSGPSRERQNDRPCATGEPRHPAHLIRSAHDVMTSWRSESSCLVDC